MPKTDVKAKIKTFPTKSAISGKGSVGTAGNLKQGATSGSTGKAP